MTDKEFNELFAKVMEAGPDRNTLLLIGEFQCRLANSKRPIQSDVGSNQDE